MVLFTISIRSLAKMMSIATDDSSNPSDNVINVLLDWKRRQGLDTYGFLALFSYISRQLLDDFNAQSSNPNPGPLFGITNTMPWSVCCYLLQSRSQSSLLQSFLIDLCNTYATTGIVSGMPNDDASSSSSKPIVTQNDDDGDASTLLGIDKGYRPNQYLDVLRLASSARVALWCYDLTQLQQIIERVSLKRFATTKDSLDVFLELVLVKKYGTLLNFTKIDKTSRGRQLLALLTLVEIDTNTNTVNTTPIVRNQLRKNAFSLIRLRKYKEAVATFLLADPPMIREASSVMCGQLGDPYYALLIVRIMEARIGAKAKPGGLLLGPISRAIISDYIVPSLSSLPSVPSLSSTISLSKFNMKSTDSLALLFLSSLWYQDMQRLRRLADLKNMFGFIKPSYIQPHHHHHHHHNDTNKIFFDSNILSAAALIPWLIAQFGRSFLSSKTTTILIYILSSSSLTSSSSSLTSSSSSSSSSLTSSSSQ